MHQHFEILEVVVKARNVRPLLLSLALVTVLSSSALFSATANRLDGSANFTTEPQNDGSAALSRGRSLLKQGHADQALGQLETALKLFTQANNSRGMAAAEDALGDLYMIQGQDKVALEHYRKAYDAFVVARGKDQ